jgi:hypothetical protein
VAAEDLEAYRRLRPRIVGQHGKQLTVIDIMETAIYHDSPRKHVHDFDVEEFRLELGATYAMDNLDHHETVQRVVPGFPIFVVSGGWTNFLLVDLGQGENLKFSFVGRGLRDPFWQEFPAQRSRNSWARKNWPAHPKMAGLLVLTSYLQYANPLLLFVRLLL